MQYKVVNNSKAWYRGSFDQKCIARIVADIYAFIMHQYVPPKIGK
jgi:hypothetical protein